MRIMRGSVLAFSLLGLTSLFSGGPCLAQEVSGLTGVVSDSTGAVVPNVAVTLTNTQTGASYATKTNSVGVYQFVRIPPGSGYGLSFTKDNFRKAVINVLTLGVGVTETQNVRLELGSVNEVIEVKISAGATLNTTDASIGNTLDTRKLEELPSLLRENPAAFLGLQAGVVANSGGGTNRNGAVTGARTDQSNITVDGIDVNDQGGQFAFATVGNAPIEAVQEFRTVTAIPNASEGRNSGAQIEIVTKGGTNQFHGSLYEFNRTSLTAANDFFNKRSATVVSRPALTRNQFGASLGGPVRKDKLFFFFNYDARRDAQGLVTQRIVPLDHVHNGSVAYINSSSPSCNAAARLDNPATASCVTILTPAQVTSLDPQGIGASAALAAVISSRYPSANDLSGGDGVNTGIFRFNAPSYVSHNTYFSRVDFKINSKQSLFGRFNILRQNDTAQVQQFPGDPIPRLSIDHSYGYSLGHTWIINSKNVNSLNFGLTNQFADLPRVFKPTFPTNFNFGPYDSAFSGLNAQTRIIPSYTIRDDYSLTRGKHIFQFGVNLRFTNQKSVQTNDFNNATIGLGGFIFSLDSSPQLRPSDILPGSVAANQQYDSVFPFLLGRFASQSTNFYYNKALTPLPPGSGRPREFRDSGYEPYFQDTWHARSDLTMTYGVRWSYFSVPYEVNGLESLPNLGIDDLFSVRVKNAANGIGGDTAAPFISYDLGGKANHARGFYEPSWTNIGPRFSLAWNPSFRRGLLHDVFGDRKTSVRLGGAILYDRVAGAVPFIADQFGFLFDGSATVNFGKTGSNAAFKSLLNDPRFTSITQPPTTVTPPVNTHPATPFVSNGVPFGTATLNGNAVSVVVDPKFKTPQAHVFSMSVQRDLPGDSLLEVSYVGRLGRRLFSQGDPTQSVNFIDPASGQGLFAAFNNVQAAFKANPNINPALVPVQPFFENQTAAAIGAPCTALGLPSCTFLYAANFQNFFQTGDLNTFALLSTANGLLRNNIGVLGQFISAPYATSRASSNYNGLLVSWRKRQSHGLQYDFNYTFSHSIDNSSDVGNTVADPLCDLTNLRVCRGNSDFDAKHLVSSNWLYELPFGRQGSLLKNAPGWANQIIGGWEVSGIWTWRTGFAFGTTSNASPTSQVLGSPGVIVGPASALASNIHTTSSGQLQFFANPTTALGAFTAPSAGIYGNRNDLRGPHFWNVDLAALKNFTLSEKLRLQFRAEAFNALNHENFVEPGTNIFSPATFGVLTTTRGSARQMQFALRLEF